MSVAKAKSELREELLENLSRAEAAELRQFLPRIELRVRERERILREALQFYEHHCQQAFSRGFQKPRDESMATLATALVREEGR